MEDRVIGRWFEWRCELCGWVCTATENHVVHDAAVEHWARHEETYREDTVIVRSVN